MTTGETTTGETKTTWLPALLLLVVGMVTVAAAPVAAQTADPAAAGDGVEWRVDRGASDAPRSPEALPPLPPPATFSTQLVQDDDSAEGTFGVVVGGEPRAFLWFNQFPSVGPFVLEEIWVLFPAGAGVAVNDPVQLAVYQDPDGDPSTGASLLATQDATVQVVDGVTFSVYPLAMPVEIDGSGDVYLGVVARFVDAGDPTTIRPAAFDTDTATGTAWATVWSTVPPNPPSPLPGDLSLVELDQFGGGTWMIRGFGSAPSVLVIPVGGPWAVAALALLLGLGGTFLLGRRGGLALVGGLVAVLAASGLVLAAAAAPATAQTVIDDFGDAQGAVEDPGGPVSSTVDQAAGTILGGERDLRIERFQGSGTASAEVLTVGSVDLLRIDAPVTAGPPDPDTGARLTATWDGNDDDADVLDATGLGGVDLTTGGASGFRFTVEASGGPTQVTVELYQDGSNASRASRFVPTVGAPTTVGIDFSELVAFEGAGADPTNVGAVRVLFFVAGTTLDVSEIAVVPPTVQAAKSALTLADAPVGPITPGTTFKYRVEVTNQAAETGATQVQDDIADITTVVPDSLTTTPIARPDQYETPGNVPKIVAAGAGLLVNDSDPDDGGALTATVESGKATALGGSVDIAADGSFTYSPPAGLRGADQFTYTVTDDEAQSATGVVTVGVGRVVWFVDSDACAPASLPCGSGTFGDPFGELEQAEAASIAGDVIRLRDGADNGNDLLAHDRGITLKPGQDLIGEAVALVIDGVTIDPAGTEPELTHSAGGNGIVLTGDHEIRGLQIDAADGVAISGSNLGTVIIADVSIEDTDPADGGSALDIDTATLDASFDFIQSNGANGHGVRLANVAGQVTVAGAVTLTDPDDRGLEITGAAAGFSWTSGAVTVTAAGAPGGADEALLLSGNNASATFTFGQLTLAAENGAGLRVSGAGIVDVLSGDNDVTATGGPAVDIGGSVVGQTNGIPGWTFDVLSSQGSPTDGVRLAGLGQDFTAASTTVTDADGTGLLVTGSAGRSFDFGLTSVTDTNVGAGANGPGVDLATGNAGASFVFDSLDVVADAGFGLRADGAASLTVSGSNNDVSATGAPALNVANVPTVAMTFDDIVANNGAGDGVRLVSLGGTTDISSLNVTTTNGVGLLASGAGSLIVDAGNLTSTNRAAVDIDNTTTDVSLTSITSNSSNDHGVDLTNLPASSRFAVSGTTDINTTTNEGLMLASIGANAVLSFGPVQVDNAGAEGIEINTVGAGSDLDFGVTDITNRNATGVFVDEMDGTSLDFGVTTIANPNSAGGYGVRVEDSGAAVAFAAANVSNTVQTVAETDPDADFLPNNEGDGDAFFLTRNPGSLAINGGSLMNSGADAIDARTTGPLLLTGVTVQNPASHGLRAIDVAGASVIQGSSTFTQINAVSRDAVRVINTIPTAMSLVVDDSDFSSSVTGNSAIFFSGRNAADMDLTVRNGSTFADFGGSAILTNAGDTPGSTARIDLDVRNSVFSASTANTLTTVAGQGLEAGTLNATVENNTFTNVARVLGSNTGVITFNGNGTSSNGVVIRGNTISSPASVTGYRGIQVFADNDSVYPANVRIENNDVFDVDREGLVLDVATNGGSPVNVRITGNDFGSATNPVGTDGDRRGVTIFTRRTNPGAPTANVLFDNNRVFVSSVSSARQPLEITAEQDATLNLTLTNSTIENLGSADDGRFTTFESGTLCLSMSGNSFGAGGPGEVNLRDFDPPTSSFDVVQASAVALGTANNSVSVVADATVAFNQPACPLPPP